MRKLTLLFALLCASVMGFAVTPYCDHTITAVDGVTTAKLTCQKTGDNTYLVSITSTAASDLSGAYFNAAPLWMYINGNETYHVGEHFERAGNTISATITSSTTPTFYTSTFYFYYPGEITFNLPNDIDFSASCGGGDPTPDPVDPSTTFNINTVWPAERVIASKSGDDFNVNIASYGGGQWQGQLKLEHNVSFENTKTYKVGFTLTADKNCGGITFKTDDNQGQVYENQSINLTANTPYHYEKVFKGQAGNNKIMVFDFGFVGENTNITISDLTLVEFSPATASSFGGDYIPFLAVDGNTGTRWQAASKGEAWWKMDYEL